MSTSEIKIQISLPQHSIGFFLVMAELSFWPFVACHVILFTVSNKHKPLSSLPFSIHNVYNTPSSLHLPSYVAGT